MRGGSDKNDTFDMALATCFRRTFLCGGAKLDEIAKGGHEMCGEQHPIPVAVNGLDRYNHREELQTRVMLL